MAYPQRRGIAKYLAMDPDAEHLLRVMVPNRHGYGLFLSELIRKEARERERRPELLATVLPPPSPERCRVAMYLALDPDAVGLLRVLVPSQKGVGVFLSELVRQEARERERRPELLEALAAVGVGSHEDEA